MVHGKGVVDGKPLPEGAVVTILAREARETTLVVSTELEAVRKAKLVEANRGDTVTADEPLVRLR